MLKRSWFAKAGLIAVAVALCATTVAIAADGVMPVIQFSKSKQVITYGEAAPFKVVAMEGTSTASFDGTVTVYTSTESSETSFAVMGSRFSTASVVPFNLMPKPSQNTWIYATYEASGGVVTTGTTAMLGVKAKLGAVTYKVPKKAASGMLTVKGSADVTPAVPTSLTVELQKLTVTTKGKGKSKKTILSWSTVQMMSPTTFGKKGAFSVSFPTTAADKGATFRAVVTYDDDMHEMASRIGHSVKLKK